MADYERMESVRSATVKVVAIFQHPDGSFSVRGTVDRGRVPVLLRSVAELIEEEPRG